MTQTAKISTLTAAIVPVTPFQQNCALLWDAKTMDGVIVDPGGDLPRIRDAIAQTGIKPVKILLTHGHIDHAGGAQPLADELGIEIEGPHVADAFLLEGLAAQGRAYGFEAFDCKPNRFVSEGETIDVAGHPFEAFHCPGHSPGSIVYVNHANKFMVMGDVLFRGSIGRTDFPYGDHEALISSIKTKLMPLGDAYAFVCGHGPGSTLGLERQTNPFLR